MIIEWFLKLLSMGLLLTLLGYQTVRTNALHVCLICVLDAVGRTGMQVDLKC
jgi:hypothetical protein